VCIFGKDVLLNYISLLLGEGGLERFNTY